MFFPSLCIPLNAQPMSQVSLRMANLKSFPPRHPKWLRLHSSQSLPKNFVSACFSGKPARSSQIDPMLCMLCSHQAFSCFAHVRPMKHTMLGHQKSLRYEWLVSQTRPSNPLSALELRITSNPRENPKQCHLMWVETRAGLVLSKSRIQIAVSQNWHPSLQRIDPFLSFSWISFEGYTVWLVTRWTGQDSQYLRMACISSNIHDFKLASLASLRFPDGQKNCRKHLDQHGPTHGQTVTTNNNELHMLTGRMRLGHLFLRNLYNLYIYPRFQTLLSALYRFST